MLYRQLTTLKTLLYSLLTLLCIIVLGLTYNLVTGKETFQFKEQEPVALAEADSVIIYPAGVSTEVLTNEAGHTLFRNNCAACHGLNEVVVGPPLAGVPHKRSKKWLYAFVQNSTKLIESKDPLAVKLYEEYGRTQMPSFSNFTTAEMDSIFDYLAAQPIRK